MASRAERRLKFLSDVLEDALEHDVSVATIHRGGRYLQAGELSIQHPQLRSAFADFHPYLHQEQSIRHIREGRDVVITTSTASGKSLCYQLPALEFFLQDKATTLALHPTKALLADQLRSWDQLPPMGATIATLDGDDPRALRAQVGKHADILLTTPDLLHAYLLPNHRRFERFFRKLGLLVIDEAHTYRGLLGSQVASVLRRTLRIAHHYGGAPQIVLTSATISNPVSFAEELVGRPVWEVSVDGSPSAPQRITLVRPEIERGSQRLRGSSVDSCARIVANYVEAGVKTLCFARTREGAERIYLKATDTLGKDSEDLIVPYRGGYLPSERREIESKIALGDALGVITTSALESGIDLAEFEAVVLQGFPGTMAAFRQQCGRVGRRANPSIVALVSRADALDTWIEAHPTELIDRPTEWGVVSASNSQVLRLQLPCAASELPLGPVDAELWGVPRTLSAQYNRVVGDLEGGGTLGRHGDRYHYIPREPPHLKVSLRGRTRSVVIVDEYGEVVGHSDDHRAPSTLYPGAQYLHKGRPLEVVSLDQISGIAFVKSASSLRISRPVTETEARRVQVLDSSRLGRIEVFHGRVEVNQRVVGFESRQAGGPTTVGELDLIGIQLNCEGTWLTLPSNIHGTLNSREVTEGAHAIEHAIIAMLPLVAISDRSDVGGISSNTSFLSSDPQFQGGDILIYESQEGGVGIARTTFERIKEVLLLASGVVNACACEDGCPSCVMSPNCGDLNDRLSRRTAVSLLGMFEL